MTYAIYGVADVIGYIINVLLWHKILELSSTDSIIPYRIVRL